MSRNAAARELENVIRQMQQIAESGERLAMASGGLVDPKHFRAARLAAMYAAGDLDSKGLIEGPTEKQAFA